MKDFTSIDVFERVFCLDFSLSGVSAFIELAGRVAEQDIFEREMFLSNYKTLPENSLYGSDSMLWSRCRTSLHLFSV